MKFALLVLLFSIPAFATKAEFVTLSSGERLFVDFKKPAGNAPTMVLLHGLTYSNKSWDSFVKAFEELDPKIGILRYDMKAMGETLLDRHLPINYSVNYQDQVNDLALLLNKLNLKKVHLVGLSYGGGIGVAFANKYPEKIRSLILMAPFTDPLKQQDDWIKYQVNLTRIANPWNPATDDELYDFYLRQFVYQSYPSAEPSILENPYKLEAVFRMAQGIRKFSARQNVKNLPNDSVHLMVAKEDQYIPGPVLDTFWKAIPKAKRVSRIIVTKTEHKMPEAIPEFISSWVYKIISSDPRISGGKTFIGSTSEQNASSGKTVIDLSR